MRWKYWWKGRQREKGLWTSQGEKGVSPAKRRDGCRKQSDSPVGDWGGESRRRGQGSAQVDTGIGRCEDWIPRHANHSRGGSKEHNGRREMGWAVV